MLMPQVLRLTRWEWYKLRRLRMPWILLTAAVLVSQLGIWVSYLAYHNDSVQEVVGGGASSYSMSWDENEELSVTMTCADVVNDRMPAGFNQLTERQQEEFLRESAAWRAGGGCEELPIR